MHRILGPAVSFAVLLACRDSAPPTAPVPSALDIGAPVVPYELIELPLPSPMTWGEAQRINDVGQIVGVGGGGGGGYHALLWQDGVVRDLGTLGGVNSRATDINELGQIVGESTLGGDIWYPFLWTDGVMTNLHPGARNFNPSVWPLLNNAGQVIWRGYPVGVSDTRDRPHAFLWSDGVLTDLAGVASGLGTINERGQVVGTTTADGRAYLWENGTLQYLPSFGSTASATAINNRGQIVGSARMPSSTITHAVLWEDGQITDLGVLPGDSSSTAGMITQSGLAVGMSANAGAGGHPFRWQRGVLSPMSPTYQTDPLFFFIDGVNNRGVMAGTRNRGAEAVVVEDGVTWVLPKPEGLHSRTADINASGDVVGWLLDPQTGRSRPVQWRRTSAVASLGGP